MIKQFTETPIKLLDCFYLLVCKCELIDIGGRKSDRNKDQDIEKEDDIKNTFTKQKIT